MVRVSKIAGRVLREREFSQIAKEMNITVGANGRCERDAIECTARLYSNYSKALRNDFSSKRPAQPVMFFDGTGSSLGRGLCHGEIGCADFRAVGDADARQSRSTLQPLFAYQGNDHADQLRSNLDQSIVSYNKLVADAGFTRTVGGVDEWIPARPIVVGDMQGAKAIFGMQGCSHSVWCKCRRGEGGSQHKYPTKPVSTYEELEQYCIDIGCELKTFDEMCEWAHYSPGVAKGGKFTPFRCSCCGYEPTEKQWYADLERFRCMTDEERNAVRAEHMDKDDELNSHMQHYHQEIFTPPMLEHGMERCGVDGLHLNYGTLKAYW